MLKTTFDPNAWDYARGDDLQLELVYRLEDKGVLAPANAGRLIAMRRYGGKAYGLVVCEALCAGFNAVSKHMRLQVPPWFPLSRNDLRSFRASWHTERQEAFVRAARKDASQRYALRSSAYEEDWQDGDSGRYRSDFMSAGSLLSPDWIDERAIASHQTPVVVQAEVKGIGVVIDIVWSELFGRVVARVAWGRGYVDDQRGTSPTWDSEALMAVFDPKTGKTLLPFFSLADRGKTRPGERAVLLAQGIYRVLQQWGWNFGVQLELIVNPYGVHLVQIRPSPALMQGHREMPEIDSRDLLLFTSPRVNRAYSVSAGAVAIHYSFCSSEYEDGEARALNFERGRETDAKAGPFDGNVGYWFQRPTKGHSGREIWGVMALGAVAQIAPSVFCNTTHDYPFQDHESEKIYRRDVQKRSALMGFHPSNQAMSWWDAYGLFSKHRGSVRVVSDGVVGRVYLVRSA